MRIRRESESGFTLLEIMVALVVLGFVLVALNQGTRFGLTAWNRQKDDVALHGELDAVERTLRRLIEGLDPASRSQPPSIVGDARRLAFTTELPQAAADALDRHADVQLGVDAGRNLRLRWTPHRHAARLAPPPSPQTVELLQGVTRLDLAYWPAEGGGWQTSWNSGEPPALVRVRIVFPDGDRRHWPDLVIAPRRVRPDG